MKVNLFALCITVSSASFLFATNGRGQDLEKTRVVLSLNHASLYEALMQIEKQSDFRFTYKDEDIKVYSNLKVRKANRSVKATLDLLLENTRLAYEQVGNYIVLREKVGELSQAADDPFPAFTVSGAVTTESGDPMPGVNIIEKGTTNGTTTDVDGKYSLNVPNEDDILVFSSIGYVAQEVPVNGRSVIDITMAEDVQSLEEVIVVGYGEQKKVNITGSVANINNEQIEGKAVTQASQALAGEISGVSVRQLSGQPGGDQATIRIRGLGTFSRAGNNPLVLIDGVPSSLDAVNPNDIKSISVLKDAASAAIYGSRAANGVILVETISGEAGELQISYNGYVGRQEATEMPQFVNSWIYAQAFNEAMVNTGQQKVYNEEDIQNFKSGGDLDNYPNKNHYKDLFTSGNGLQTKHNISFKGGTSKTQYLFSAGYLKQNGIVQENFNQRYDMRLNLNSKLSDDLQLNVNLSGNQSHQEEPAATDDWIGGLIWGAIRLTPDIPGRRSDGTFGHKELQATEAYLASESFGERKNAYFLGNANLEWNIIEPLKISGKIGYAYNDSKNRRFGAGTFIDPNLTIGPNRLETRRGSNTNLILQSLITYDKSFGDHDIYILGGYSQEENNNDWISAYRDNFPNNKLYQLNAASSGNMQNGGSASRWRLRSYFSRVNYSYQGKYLLEANLRYDGSSRFPEDNRYDLFPSFSAGWRISEENFFQNAIPWVDDLKIRGSWGKLGNQNIGTYPYQEVINLGQDYPFGGSLNPGAAVTTLPNQNITWETTGMTDVGLDITVLSGRLNFTTDYFYKKTSDILYNISTSSILGMSPSEQNAGTVENKGWDFQLSHRNNLGDFSYSISPNFSIVENKVLELANVERDIAKGLFVGEPLESIYGYIADGLFVDEADIQNYPDQPYDPQPGQIRYKDISGPEGVPDGKVTQEYDRKVIGSQMPKYMYGLRIAGNYKKGFDFLILLQGEGGMERVPQTYSFAFQNGGNIQEWQWEQRWTAENPDRNAGYPRLEFLPHSMTHPNNFRSSFWAQNASFLRIKNVQIGYNLSSSLIDKLFLNRLRVYISGQNLIAFDHYYEGWDPEMNVSGSSQHYPPTRLFTAGIDISF